MKFNKIYDSIIKETITSVPMYAASTGKNIDFRGPLPTGFKGAGPQGIAPGATDSILLRLTNKKKNKKIKGKKTI